MRIRHWLTRGAAVCALAATVPALAMNYVVELGQADLQRKIERLFPVSHQDPLYDLLLSEPRVVLREGGDRIGLGLKLSGTLLQWPVAGRAQVTGGLRFEPASGEFYLRDATVEELAIDGVPEQYAGELRRIAEQAAREMLNSRPIYVLGQLGESKQPLGREIKAINVRGGKLVLELEMF